MAEIFLRGTVVYLFLFFLLRLLRREAGAIGISDLLLVVLIADAAQNAMSSDYKSITDGVILVGAIAFWDYFLNWLSYRFPSVRRMLRPPPLLLVKDGRMLRRNMRQEMITEEELMGQLRENRAPRVSEIETCVSNYLVKQIELINPKLIMLLGAVAAKKMLGVKSVEEARGRIIERDGRKYLVGYHPALQPKVYSFSSNASPSPRTINPMPSIGIVLRCLPKASARLMTYMTAPIRKIIPPIPS